MTPSYPKPVWLDRFANRLGVLLPTIDAQSASAAADATFVDAADLSPEEAADIYALEAPPDDPGATGD